MKKYVGMMMLLAAGTCLADTANYPFATSVNTANGTITTLNTSTIKFGDGSTQTTAAGSSSQLGSTQTWTANQTYANQITISSAVYFPGADGAQLHGAANGLRFTDATYNLDMAIMNMGSNLFYLPQMSVQVGSSFQMKADTWNSTSAAGITVLDNTTSAFSVSAATFSVNGVVAFSTGPVFHASANSAVGTLAAGTTFYKLVATNPITLTRACATVVAAGTGGSGDTWVVSNGTSTITATTGAAAAAGTTVCASGSVATGAGSSVTAYVTSGANPRPIANIDIEYKMQ